MFVIYYYLKTPGLQNLGLHVLMEDTSVSNNTNTPSNTKKRREEMQNQDNSESNLNEALLSVLINLQNA